MSEQKESVVTAKPVEATSDGKDTQQSEKTYTEADFDRLFDSRFKKHKAEKAELEKQLADEKAKPKVKAAVEDELREQVSKYETDLKSKDEKLKSYQDKTLKAELERELTAQKCYDPQIVMNDLLFRNLVKWDGDEIVAETAKGKSVKVSELVKQYLEEKPYLREGQQSGGVGTKGPQVQVTGDLKNMKLSEMEQRLGITEQMKRNYKR